MATSQHPVQPTTASASAKPAMEAALRELSEWVALELPDARRDEHFLRRFLHGCKMRLAVAKTKLRNLHKLRERTPQWFGERDPELPEVASLLQLGVFLPLPDKDEEGRTIIVVRATINDPSTQPMNHVFKVGLMVLDLALEQDESIAQHGVAVLIDLAGVSIYHAIQMTPSLIIRTVHSWQDCYPVRIKSIHFLNCPYHVNAVLSLFKKVMKEKLRRRVHTHGRDLTVLHKQVPPSLLPTEYQGTRGTIQDTITHWCSLSTSKRDWFLAQDRSGP